MVTDNLVKDSVESPQSNDEEVLVKVDHVSKKFCRTLKKSLWYGIQDIGSEIVGRKYEHQLRPDEFWSVNDVSFELRRGECLGLIGHNGAGKTTLLRMLNGLIKPDKGSIEMRGQVGALIALGAGFNPILTGRENIYINASVLGISTKEIDQKIDQIVDFAEIGKFIDMPVQNYSSGMKVRLGFAVAINLNPDILLVDEVLAVGDVGFKIKCYNEINKMLENTGVIFVTHSMPQVGRICTRSILMQDGKASVISDNPSEAIVAYYNMFEGENVVEIGSKRAEITQIDLSQEENLEQFTYSDIFESNSVAKFELIPEKILQIGVYLNIDSDVEKFQVKFLISDMDQKVVAQFLTAQPSFINKKDGLNLINININDLILNTGTYFLNITVVDKTKTSNSNDESQERSSAGEILLGYKNIVKLKTNLGSYVGAAPVLFKEKS